MEPNGLLAIGALSQRTHATIRYYERIGILPKPLRSKGGHRLYCDEHRQQLLFVRRARELGFSLEEVRVLLRLAQRRSAGAEVKSITERHIAVIGRKIKELKCLELALGAMVTQCRGDETSDCPILDALAR